MPFTISYSGTTILQDCEIWPNEDGPEEPDLDDVLRMMRKCGKGSLLYEWLLAEDVIISVDGIPV